MSEKKKTTLETFKEAFGPYPDEMKHVNLIKLIKRENDWLLKCDCGRKIVCDPSDIHEGLICSQCHTEYNFHVIIKKTMV